MEPSLPVSSRRSRPAFLDWSFSGALRTGCTTSLARYRGSLARVQGTDTGCLMSDHRGICRWPQSRVWQVTFEFCRLHLGRLRGVHFPSPDAGELQACDPDDQPSRTAVRRGRRRQKIFPNVWVERVAPELMFGMMIRASERCTLRRAADGGVQESARRENAGGGSAPSHTPKRGSHSSK